MRNTSNMDRQNWTKFQINTSGVVVKAARYCVHYQRLPRFVFVDAMGKRRLRLKHRCPIVKDGTWIVVSKTGIPFRVAPAVFNRNFTAMRLRILYR